MSHIKRVISDLKFIRGKNKSVPKIYAKKKEKDLLVHGYKEMASLNLSFAEMCVKADNEAMSVCEEKLTECE